MKNEKLSIKSIRNSVLRRGKRDSVRVTILAGLVVALSAYFLLSQYGYSDEHPYYSDEEGYAITASYETDADTDGSGDEAAFSISASGDDADSAQAQQDTTAAGGDDGDSTTPAESDSGADDTNTENDGENEVDGDNETDNDGSNDDSNGNDDENNENGNDNDNGDDVTVVGCKDECGSEDCAICSVPGGSGDDTGSTAGAGGDGQSGDPDNTNGQTNDTDDENGNDENIDDEDPPLAGNLGEDEDGFFCETCETDECNCVVVNECTEGCEGCSYEKCAAALPEENETCVGCEDEECEDCTEPEDEELCEGCEDENCEFCFDLICEGCEDEECLICFPLVALAATKDFTLSGYNRTGTPVATVRIPVAKTITGYDALEELEDNDERSAEKGHFMIVAKNSTNDIVAFERIVKSDFDGDTAVATLTINIPSYGTYYFEISEISGTAGDNWFYDSNTHDIIISVDENTGVVTVTYADGGDVLGWVSTNSTHSRKPSPYSYIPPLYGPEDEHTLISQTPFPMFGKDTAHQIAKIQTDKGELFALCADWHLTMPANNTGMFVEDSRDNAHSALAFALFSDQFGAKLKDEDFFKIFDYELDDFGGIENASSARKGLMQFAIWYYEDKARWSGFPLFTFDLDNLDTWGPSDPGGGLISLYERFMNHTDQSYGNEYIDILKKLNRMMGAYNENKPGESPTTLYIEYNESEIGTRTITVGYEGFRPIKDNLILDWDPTGVKVFRGTVQLTPGDVVFHGEELIIELEDDSKPVTFILTDKDNYFLANGSIRGALFRAPANLPLHPKGQQALITGVAEFVKVSASLTIGGDMPPFENTLGGPQLPDTGGVGVAAFTTAGAVLMLVSASGIVARGARRPVFSAKNISGTKLVRTRRILSLTGKRIKRTWRWYGTKK